MICFQVRYLHDYAERLELNVQFFYEITEIGRDQNGTGLFYLQNQNGTSYSCRVVVVRYAINVCMIAVFKSLYLRIYFPLQCILAWF